MKSPVATVLGIVSYDYMINLLNSIIWRNSIDAIKIIERIHEEGKDLKQFIRQFQKFVVDVCRANLDINFTCPFNKASVAEMPIDSVREILKWLLKLGEQIKFDNEPKHYLVMQIILEGWLANDDNRK